MTVLRLSAVAGTRLGPALAAVDGGALVRRAGASYAEVPAAQVARFVRSLALAGIDATPSDARLEPARGTLAARGADLRPLEAGTVDLDVVRFERLPIGRATREVLRRRLWGALPASERDRSRCRAVLRHDDALFAWARRAWGPRDALRSPRARRVLRPIVFMRPEVDRWELAGRTTAASDDIGKWLFA